MDFSGLAEQIAQHGLPGLALGVCTADSVLWSGGFGVTRAGGGRPIGTDTMFSVQSCSKMYTATAVLHAVREGLVELEVPIVRYLPEFRVRSAFEEHPERRITMRHLLSHTAGFTHEAPVGSNYLVGRESFEAHCRSISETWLRFPVGHRFEYSNLGIDLAGYIVQRRSGLPFHEYVRRSLFEPLGLRRTSFDSRVIERETDRAIGHSKGYSRRPVRVPMVAAGGVSTSVADACRRSGARAQRRRFRVSVGHVLGSGIGIRRGRTDEFHGSSTAVEGRQRQRGCGRRTASTCSTTGAAGPIGCVSTSPVSTSPPTGRCST
ncbi:serine hydrolase domain-containing protein [Kribbella sp. NPDC059898]|uniref:serine hydrolase domain-containing protein n=1 Tax=Kribbella sp. NPDC059898 TaxID=3346995 RepID=UPI003664D59C